MNPTLVVTAGDPRGIGPELLAPAAEIARNADPGVELVFVGPDATLPPGEHGLSVGRFDGSAASAGRLSALALERAAQLCLAGEAHGIVTAPVHKPSLHEAGWREPGQTEILGRLAATDETGMLMCAEATRLGGPLRVLLATTHVALKRVPSMLSVDLLVTKTALLASSLRSDWAIAMPRLALCALNPHASDGGLFGDEEERVYAPAVETLVAAGHDVTGPVPADTVFYRAVDGEFDAVLVPYHDVGMAAFKTVSFGRGVNVTLGLPFVRTSPDHGTAFDIAGSGRADPSSMAEALSLAVRLARARSEGAQA